jgi:hypothetical protein
MKLRNYVSTFLRFNVSAQKLIHRVLPALDSGKLGEGFKTIHTALLCSALPWHGSVQNGKIITNQPSKDRPFAFYQILVTTL